MNSEELFDIIRNRRSVRKYNDKPVDPAIIHKLIDAARWAPSAGNQQPLRIIVVTRAELKEKLNEATNKQAFFVIAPYILVICSDLTDTVNRYKQRGEELYHKQDTAAAIQNILLLATTYNLQSCWIGAFNEDIVKDAFKLPENVRPVAIIPIAYTDSELPAGPGRKELDTIIHYETY